MGIQFINNMKVFAVLAANALGQYNDGYGTGGSYDATNSGYAAAAGGYQGGSCGPSAAYGGAYWPSLSADHPCGVNFWSDQVKANSKCQLQLVNGASYFLSLGGVFVTTPASAYNDNTFYFHTYDNWQGQYGVSVLNFWQNSDFPSNSSCFDADSICITCTEEPDSNGDGYSDTVQGVYLGNFMHDFRHDSPSQTNVPIANSNGHVNGTVYTVSLMDQYGNAVPITNIASHYGHEIGSATNADGIHSADDGKFTLHVGCEDFNGQFLYFSFTHQGDAEANGWYSFVTESSETLVCETPDDSYGNTYAAAGNNGQNADNSGSQYAANGNQYAGTNTGGQYAATGGASKNKNKNKNKNKFRGDYYDGNSTDYGDYNNYDSYYDNTNYVY